MPRFNNNIILQSLVAAERHQRLTSPPRGRLNVHPCSCTFQLRQSSGKKQGARVSALNAGMLLNGVTVLKFELV